ncbi:MutS-related protein [Empedobacter sp. UBA5637]|uniref:MutS-related protein n=1 Tax=Empedobacter sp. UBA5637 TaxID=1946442 RepID=UPI0032E39ABA
MEFYLSKIDISVFPKVYSKKINFILNFLSFYNLKYFNNLINNNKLSVNDISVLLKKILITKEQFREFYNSLLEFEVFLSISTSIENNNYHFPSFDTNEIYFKDIYHPLIKSPVSNDVYFNKNVIILTGPNMSGKSTFLKTIFIGIYLSHLGLAIPAKESKIPFFEYFSISINHNDNLKAGYSHFMNEILLLKESLINVRKGLKCFVIFDELFKGTNIDDAFQISSQTIKGLLNFSDSFFIISTHIQTLIQVSEIKNNNTDNYYIDSSLINDEPYFSYKLKKGWSNLRIGEILFKKEGLSLLLNSK